MNLKEAALAYEPKKTLNVCDLDVVPVIAKILESEEKENSEGEKYRYKYLIADNKEYRIPEIVLEGMQEILKNYPKTQTFKVTRKGQGKATRYQVMAGQ